MKGGKGGTFMLGTGWHLASLRHCWCVIFTINQRYVCERGENVFFVCAHVYDVALYLFSYLTTILLQVVAWLVQFCRVTPRSQTAARLNSKKTSNTQNEYTALLESIAAFYFRNSSTALKIATETAVGASGTPCRYKRNKSARPKQWRSKGRPGGRGRHLLGGGTLLIKVNFWK